jgi:hypothetical protein
MDIYHRENKNIIYLHSREEFEKVAEAYEFLSNFHAENKESYGPNLYHISLYIKSQTLLFWYYFYNSYYVFHFLLYCIT